MRTDANTRTPAERRAARRYMWEVGAGALGFMILFLVLPRVIQVEDGTPGSIVMALAPLAPVCWIAIALVRHVRRVDELQRTLVWQSFALGFGAAMLIALTIALLGTAGITVAHTEWYVFIGGMVTWGVTICALSFRASR